MDRYKEMPASKNRPFVFLTLLEISRASEKWKLREQEAPPKKETMIPRQNRGGKGEWQNGIFACVCGLDSVAKCVTLQRAFVVTSIYNYMGALMRIS
jgi:hypothetical protein